MTTLGNNARLENASVSNLMITGTNVTVRNVSVSGSLGLALASDVMISRVTARSVGISSSSNVTLEYSRIGGGQEDAIHLTSDRGRLASNILLRYNYLSNPRPASDAHYDGTQVRGVNGLTISCSVYDPGSYVSQLNAAIYLEDANGGDSNVTLDRNWLYGYGYTLMLDRSSGTRVTNNRFGGDIQWGPCFAQSGFSFTQSGNVWDSTGAAVGTCKTA